MSALIDYTSEENYVIITLNNGKVNAISHEVIDSLNQLLDKAETQKKVVILTGQPGVFSAGYDLKSMTTSPESALKLVTKGSKLSHRMLSFPTPIIAACTGHAIAKGAFLLLSTDYRLGAEGNFKIGFNEVLIGMTMHNAGVQIAKGRLTPNYVNRSVNNAEMYSPKDAVTAGLLDKIVPENQVLPIAIKIAEMFAKLNLKAHHQTKLKVRKTALRSLKKAIKKDAENGLNPPSK
ncbi:crotonase/enoyl-CoA hydratase family protein [Tenacibaculum finnmarkense genomovar finnmarkense]|uniref:crotonase/enoyl-CoA hydratase family protein n=1 Tax=Tenacibaculum finnmarkense TaxID=2781243 RepID=UPI00187BB05A|nr:crotonase/enoyl-CoA hydratase family protein [Tenacibaculum finnmarkense]MBE7661300.1 crotonase/enoyl-CoA hydratase family protein [Tenacibaculum finnmarkense genomovar finnmarkense]MCD8417487.1 crotonase/enoyl-CoA hydratase family protein [Tenacibaculum finnmarkense genomovar finnmarkense]MCG8185871.1 crotonase/enoyl-CoA hydratase family protein [Tenacibaculum finnmarkense genomovar finnmarkense]MCG8202423.1 crotonase/enoyl-CoA hydratase family protein [Tenacibaculum finnmarkense genomovar 